MLLVNRAVFVNQFVSDKYRTGRERKREKETVPDRSYPGGELGCRRARDRKGLGGAFRAQLPACTVTVIRCIPGGDAAARDDQIAGFPVQEVVRDV